MGMKLKIKDMAAMAVNALRQSKDWKGYDQHDVGMALRHIRDQVEAVQEAEQSLREECGEENEHGQKEVREPFRVPFNPAFGEMAGKLMPPIGDWKRYNEEMKRLQEKEIEIPGDPIGIGKNQSLPEAVVFEFLAPLFRCKDRPTPKAEEKPEPEGA